MNLKIRFKSEVLDEVKDRKGRTYKNVRRTSCMLYDKDEVKDIVQVQLCSEDQDVKLEGQKQALYKLLNRYDFDRPVRKELWNQFWSRFGGKGAKPKPAEA